MLEDGDIVTPSVAAKPRSRGAASELGSAAPSGRPASVEKAPPAPEPAKVVTPSVAAEPRSRGAAPDVPVTIQKLRAAWTTIRGKVEAERPPLRAPLSGAMVDSIDGNAVVLKLRRSSTPTSSKITPSCSKSAIADVLGRNCRFASKPAHRPQPKQQSLRRPNEEESADELFGYANERIK